MAETSETNTNSRSVQEIFAEGRRYFMGTGSLNTTLARLAADLKACDIDYAVVGAVALLAYGYPRFTEDIDLILTPEGLEKFHRELLGLGGYGLVGYTPAFPGSRKRFKSFPEGISIDVIISGEFPGDGKPKAVSMPEPASVSVEIDGVRFVTLEKLIELKLASGMTAPDRLKDLADVQELIKVRTLKKDFASRLDPYVKDKFLELCEAVEKSSTS
jgi:hypothetical protein